MEMLIYENRFSTRLSFSMRPSDLRKLGYFRFTMPLIDESQTAHQPPRPIPIHLREKVDKEIENWQSLGIIQPTQSGFNIPLIIFKKADGSLRISLRQKIEYDPKTRSVSVTSHEAMPVRY